ncbi:MAG: hypothetical protein ACI4I6_08175 [Hominimerdicola sp.]
MKKYAVYSSETGYSCYEYIDSIEKLKGTDLEDIVDEENLPVILNGKGGYYRFRDDDYTFYKIIESDKENPLSLEQMFFKNDDRFKLGWLSPDGDTYSCDYTGHTKCAAMIVASFFPGAKQPERTLGKAGWLKIIDSWNGTERKHRQFVYSFTGKITKCQADKLFDLGLYDNDEVQKLIKECEDYW